MNWKEKAKELIYNMANINYDEDGDRCFYEWEVIDMMEEFAELACVVQRKICADEALCRLKKHVIIDGKDLLEDMEGREINTDDGIISVDPFSILRAPLVNFNTK